MKALENSKDLLTVLRIKPDSVVTEINLIIGSFRIQFGMHRDIFFFQQPLANLHRQEADGSRGLEGAPQATSVKKTELDLLELLARLDGGGQFFRNLFFRRGSGNRQDPDQPCGTQ